MSATMEKLFNLPDLGEGLTESEILSWRVAVGENVELNQIIAEVETAKAVVELPSPFSGVVTRLFEPAGAVVNVGNPIISFDVPATHQTEQPTVQKAQESTTAAEGTASARQPTLVGYGAAVEAAGRPSRRGRVAAAAVQAQPQPESTRQQVPGPVTGSVRARPPVRKLARDSQLDLSTVFGSGEGGLITREDVVTAVARSLEESVGAASDSPQENQGETRVAVRGVRKATANAMVTSAFSAPHVTEFLSVDVTETMELVDRLRAMPRLADVKITITSVVAKAVSLLLARHQGLNSRWDEASGEIIEYHYVNLGIAAATERGLLVPVLKGSHALSLEQVAGEISALTTAARSGTITPAQLNGATFTMSNIGVFGVDSGTPILPPGQSGILAIGQVRKMPWEYRDEVALRKVMTLSLSFDHRVVDGEQGAKFLSELGLILRDPALLIASI
ncbi:dihydrolipoamide acetyltransferase family protein [Paeniglutamicibacter terrestris]|uniref:Dihydrolipoamide acetyltransferase component of pyruvate dehydrogenase complex n=1 Tax=Paeniglutamicibacter terrestris TaxID=2723403 RepID=A0ABX1G7T5_9MICC|nr:dihydrolipoamide acetyltransferase family protein [Paeniglutamicibacter terrestris]ASN40070.1 branched-chain alpha-keto acid dehydrogenase subunit E2 [Arthrobacter sp. 7749]NKG22099.1 2-oxo acid dehydrogenase subunit E2 [Paeniglutamicibacter terrestris]